MKNVCFTGHRSVKITPKLREELTRTVEDLIKKGAADFYAGGAFGFDMLCENVVLGLGEKYPHIQLHLILPDPLNPRPDEYRYRNRKLVDNADICVCYYNEKDVRSGTGQTVRMAQKKGIEIINLFHG